MQRTYQRLLLLTIFLSFSLLDNAHDHHYKRDFVKASLFIAVTNGHYEQLKALEKRHPSLVRSISTNNLLRKWATFINEHPTTRVNPYVFAWLCEHGARISTIRSTPDFFDHLNNAIIRHGDRSVNRRLERIFRGQIGDALFDDVQQNAQAYRRQ